MNIGFDAKRVFFNRSGLGNYSRSTVQLLSRFVGEHKYTLFAAKKGNLVDFEVPDGIETVYPDKLLWRKLSSLWRSYRMSAEIKQKKIDIYHGLSNELPADIKFAGCKSVVTMHDIIFVRFPELYKPIDRLIYTMKYRRSCHLADRVIAISNQTKDDLVKFWNINPDKIDVVYQGCNPLYYQIVSGEGRDFVRKKYNLPEKYILSVGTVEARKNLMLTVKAMAQGGVNIPLVVCGAWTPYKEQIDKFAEQNGIDHLMHFYNNVDLKDLPAIYQQSECLVYASIFEGFGIPILEGLNSGVPVITSKGGVFPESGGDACYYVDATSVDEMLEALEKVLHDNDLRENMIEKGYQHVQKFREEEIAKNIMNVYNKIIAK